MHTLTKTSRDLVHELFNLSQIARNLYASASQSHDSPGIRALKTYLAERHSEHLRDLRHDLHTLGGTGSLPSHPGADAVNLGLEIQRALTSANRALVLLACAQIEKQIALAYDRVSRDLALTEVQAHETVARHIGDLKASQIFVRQIEAEQSRSSQARNSNLAAS